MSPATSTALPLLAMMLATSARSMPGDADRRQERADRRRDQADQERDQGRDVERDVEVSDAIG